MSRALYRYRGVAQFGRVPGLGPGGRRFEPCHPDEYEILIIVGISFFLNENLIKCRDEFFHPGIFHHINTCGF